MNIDNFYNFVKKYAAAIKFRLLILKQTKDEHSL